MIKQIIFFFAVFGLATCYPAKLSFGKDLVRINEKLGLKLDQKALPSVSSIDAGTILELVSYFPGDWTLNDIIIAATQTVFIEILNLNPVPEWFDGKFL